MDLELTHPNLCFRGKPKIQEEGEEWQEGHIPPWSWQAPQGSQGCWGWCGCWLGPCISAAWWWWSQRLWSQWFWGWILFQTCPIPYVFAKRFTHCFQMKLFSATGEIFYNSLCRGATVDTASRESLRKHDLLAILWAHTATPWSEVIARIEVSMDQKDFCCVLLIRFMVRKEMIPTMIDRRDETITENN